MYHRFEENKYPSTNIRNEIFSEHIKEINNSGIKFISFKKFEEITKEEITKKYNNNFKVITKRVAKYFDNEILKLNNLNIVTLDHNELEFLRLRNLLEKNLIRPMYLS